MSQQILRDRNGKMIGMIRPMGTGDKRRDKLVNRDGLLMGFYDHRTGHTLDRNGNLYAANCNVLVALLDNKK